MKNITIDVNMECITKGKKKSRTCCPIALALKQCPYFFKTDIPVVTNRVISVESKRIKTLPSGKQKVWTFLYTPTPKKARVFIKKFDNGLPVKPFRLTLKDKN